MSCSFSGSSILTWKRSTWHTGIRVIAFAFSFTGVHVKCFSTRRQPTSRTSKVQLNPPMAEESDAFYVVRKGDVVGIYKKLSDCQAQVSSSVCDSPVSVYKGYSLPKETEKYLTSQGFKGALYSMHAAHLRDDMFGSLISCPFQQPDGPDFLVDKKPKRSSPQKKLEMGIAGSNDVTTTQANKLSKTAPTSEAQPFSRKLGITGSNDIKVAPTSEAHSFKNKLTCILEFDGASKGNPGKAGAGAVLKTEDGNVVSRVRESLGIATNNVAEYRALILGLKYALMRGFKHIRVQGDSKLVCMQVKELWQTKNQNMADLCKEAKRLKDMFQSFSIVHVDREFNSYADNLANLALDLPVGEVCEDSDPLSAC